MSRNLYKRFVLSGAITGHQDEAKVYFDEACKIILERFPLAEIFNPAMIGKLVSYKAAMIICTTRIRGWATDIVYIKNNYYDASEGAKEEKRLAQIQGLGEYELHGKQLIEVTGGG